MKSGVAWTLLMIGTVVTIVGFAALKAYGDSKPVLAAVGVAVTVLGYSINFHALRGLPMGIGYGVWSGVSILLTTLVGIRYFGEPVNAAKLVFLALTLAGIAGMACSERGNS